MKFFDTQDDVILKWRSADGVSFPAGVLSDGVNHE